MSNSPKLYYEAYLVANEPYPPTIQMAFSCPIQNYSWKNEIPEPSITAINYFLEEWRNKDGVRFFYVMSDCKEIFKRLIPTKGDK